MKTNENQLKEVCKHYYLQWTGSEKLANSYTSQYSTFLRLDNGGILGILKLDERLKTYERSGQNKVESLRKKAEETFRSLNMSQINREIQLIKETLNSKDFIRIAIFRDDFGGKMKNSPIFHLQFFYSWMHTFSEMNERFKGRYEKLTDNDLRAILSIYEQLALKREKRINTYLKRYGTEKYRILS